MSDSEVATAAERSVSVAQRGTRQGTGRFTERRRSPRPRLAEIRRGAELNLLPPAWS